MIRKVHPRGLRASLKHLVFWELLGCFHLHRTGGQPCHAFLYSETFLPVPVSCLFPFPGDASGLGEMEQVWKAGAASEPQTHQDGLSDPW